MVTLQSLNQLTEKILEFGKNFFEQDLANVVEYQVLQLYPLQEFEKGFNCYGVNQLPGKKLYVVIRHH